MQAGERGMRQQEGPGGAQAGFYRKQSLQKYTRV